MHNTTTDTNVFPCIWLSGSLYFQSDTSTDEEKKLVRIDEESVSMQENVNNLKIKYIPVVSFWPMSSYFSAALPSFVLRCSVLHLLCHIEDPHVFLALIKFTFACTFPLLPPEEDLISLVPFSSLHFIKTPTSLLIRYSESIQERWIRVTHLDWNPSFVFVNFYLSLKVLNFSNSKISGSSSRGNLVCNSWEHLEREPRTSICTAMSVFTPPSVVCNSLAGEIPVGHPPDAV